MKRLLLMTLAPLAMLSSPVSAGTIVVDGRFDGQFGASSFTDTNAIFTGTYIDDTQETVDSFVSIRLTSLTARFDFGNGITQLRFTDPGLLNGLGLDANGMPVIALFGRAPQDVLFAYKPFIDNADVLIPTDDSGAPVANPAFAVTTGTGTGTSTSTIRITGGTGLSTTFPPDDVAAVPEPATWAMMIVGFGLIGGGMRRRRHNIAFRFA